jgi:hypothetical protein
MKTKNEVEVIMLEVLRRLFELSLIELKRGNTKEAELILTFIDKVKDLYGIPLSEIIK